MDMKRILFIIGSLRAKSFNRQVACVVKDVIGESAEVQELDYSDLPLLSQDIEQPELEAWTEGRMILSDEQKVALKNQVEAFLKIV